MNSSLISFNHLISSYNNLVESNFRDQSNEYLKHIVYDTILKEAENLLTDEERISTFCLLGNIAKDALSDFSFPSEKSEILLRLYFDGCCKAHDKGINSVHLDDFITNYRNIINQWYHDVINDLYRDAKLREKLTSTLGDLFSVKPINERIQYQEDLFKDFFEYIKTKDIGIKVRYNRAIGKMALLNISILYKYYGLDLY